MGGYGSGRRGGMVCGKRDTLEEFPRLDVRVLHRWRMLTPGPTGHRGPLPYAWNRRGEPAGDVLVTTDEAAGALAVDYRYRRGEGDPWQQARHVVTVARTPCGWGGTRPWLLCPECGRRCGVLVLRSPVLACRRCFRLPYESQSEDQAGRARLRFRNLDKRLPDGRRPRGMRRRTYARLCARWCAAAEADEALFVAKCERLVAACDRRSGRAADERRKARRR